MMLSLPWSWTDLPVPNSAEEPPDEEASSTLLSPAALRDLVRFVRGQRQRRQGEPFRLQPEMGTSLGLFMAGLLFAGHFAGRSLP
jgi:hypothetical protein